MRTRDSVGNNSGLERRRNLGNLVVMCLEALPTFLKNKQSVGAILVFLIPDNQSRNTGFVKKQWAYGTLFGM